MSRHTPLRIAFQRPWPTMRRGLILWFYSFGVLALGLVNYIATDLPAQTRASLAFVLNIGPASGWGWLMVAVASLSLWSSYCHMGRDKIGFVILSSFLAGWGCVYLSGWLFFDAGLRAIGGSVIWFVFAAGITLTAGFPNVPMKQHPLLESEEVQQ